MPPAITAVEEVALLVVMVEEGVRAVTVAVVGVTTVEVEAGVLTGEVEEADRIAAEVVVVRTAVGAAATRIANPRS